MEHLIKLIRKEETSLWIGAGFSLYAGFPSGQKLSDLIKAELTANERAQLPQHASLRTVADAFITFRNGSRNELNQILVKEFTRPPESTFDHDLLSRIPHFKEIITTNYDGMIENSYGGRAHVVRNDTDIPYTPNNITTIYKVHGDLLSRDNIIISGNDYARFIGQIRPDNPLWTAIRHTLAQKSLLFLGYGFEDENLWSWLDTIDSAVGSNRKERFLIGPNWPELRIKQLYARGITYFDSTADVFLQELHLSLKQNIVADLENGWVSQDTFNRYITLHDYDSKLDNRSGKSKLSALYKEGKSTLNKVNFMVKEDAGKKIAAFQKGFGNKVRIDRSQLLQFEHFVDDFKLNMSAATIQSFQLVRLPQYHKARLYFPDDDLTLDDLTFELSMVKKSVFKIISNVYGFKVVIFLTYSKNQWKINVTLNSPEKFPAMHKCITIMRTILNYVKGNQTILHWNETIKNITNVPPVANTAFWETQLQFYKGIKLIENYFSLNFEGREADHSDEEVRKVARIATLIEKRFIRVGILDGIQINTGTVDELLEPLPPDVTAILVKLPGDNIIDLFGENIDLGESVLQVEDIEPINYSDDGKSALVKSKTGIAFQRYDAFPTLETLNPPEVKE